MCRDDLDDLVLLRAPDGGQVPCGGQCFSFRSRFESVSYATCLTMSCRNEYWPRSGERGSAWIEEHLLAEEDAEQRLQLGFAEAGERAEALLRERLPEHRAVLDEPALLGCQPVEPGGDERLRLNAFHSAAQPIPIFSTGKLLSNMQRCGPNSSMQVSI